ncbi:isoprenylcysteine carboxyl methyltransferase family protein [Bacillus mesophilum]|uniref:Isoprenylcysteine carboxyl methyltransferase n=1 Tax=Bacillus mesophilum TaxID=1071718 RepID=A0A7V7RMP6_9BACI|nr:isoprenylcysteine carboxylmethyltransferase family protein [Bacillus mesophilum]KAB2333619.1 isoprenylcysteine carboxyl methyltransferase [Bacillus mesophilum]
MNVFYIVFSLIVLQRLCELFVAKHNEKWMKERGALEFGQAHYPFIVLLHTAFFISLLGETVFLENSVSSLWKILLPMFILLQAGRIWALFSLGRYWNTKIIVMPNAEAVRKGPYKWIKHPNYVIVALELMVIPLLFQAYMTFVLFTLLNIGMMMIRIPAEEKALLNLAGDNRLLERE